MEQLQIVDTKLLTKAGIAETATQIVQALDNGEVNPLDLKLAFKAIEDLGKKVKGTLDTHLVEEASKYTKTFMYKGSEFTTMEAGTRYDYSECGHQEYNDLVSQIKVLEARKKEIEEDLKGIKGSRTEVNEDTGEIIKLYPPKKTSTTTVSTTIK